MNNYVVDTSGCSRFIFMNNVDERRVDELVAAQKDLEELNPIQRRLKFFPTE
jgi:hypothetical protein